MARRMTQMKQIFLCSNAISAQLHSLICVYPASSASFCVPSKAQSYFHCNTDAVVLQRFCSGTATVMQRHCKSIAVTIMYEQCIRATALKQFAQIR